MRNDDGLVRGQVRLGRLSEGRHVWKWDGRDNDGAVVADGSYRVRLKAVTATRTQKAMAYAHVDTVRPRGHLLTTRPTAYPKASVVDDHVLLVWVLIVFWVLPEMCRSGYDCSQLMERKRAD